MKKILVVETSQTIMSVADSLLRQKGFDVTCLSNGREAAGFAKAEQPDLIISGLGLEEINGIELCRRIASDPLTGGIPVVLLIGDNDGVYLDQIEVCGARGRLKKPFSPKELLAVVDKYAGGGGAMQITRIVDQNAEDAPRLRTQDLTQDESAEGSESDVHRQKANTSTHINLNWDDLQNPEEIKREPTGKINFDDTGLVLEEDQYGLTNYSDQGANIRHRPQDEDYDWFINEMKREIQPSKNLTGTGKVPVQGARKPPKGAEVSYQDIGTPVSEDEGKYKRFLEEFKKDAGVLTQPQANIMSQADLNVLADIIAEKMARKIVEKINKEDIKQVILSVLPPRKQV